MELPTLATQLQRLDALVNWEDRRRSPSPGTQGSGMRVDVEPARDLLERLGSPERGLRVVHVAGTKGKGSVASLVHHALVRAGFRVGGYTSPHVERIHERIAIDGRPIEDQALADVLAAALDAKDAACAERTAAAGGSWFDVLTAAAILHFHRSGAEWAVVECGLGGRLDSTNALSGEVCVVTNVDLEHTEVLGATHAAIAREKAGILDPGATLVTGVPADTDAGRVVDGRARDVEARVVRLAVARRTMEDENAALAGLVLDELGARGVRDRAGVPIGAHLVDASTRRAARLPGRLEVFRVRDVPVVLDGAHVPSSLERVFADLEGREELSRSPAIAVLGAGRDKQVAGLLKVLSKRVDRVVCTSVGTGPVALPEEIAGEARRIGLAAETAVGPRMALQRALDLCEGTGWVLVTGSLHLIGALRTQLTESRC